MRHFITAILLAATLMAGAQQNDYCGPVPNANQLRWQQMEMYAFIHYSLNTYTDQEWGFGNEDPKLFNPSDLDCRQWARILKFEATRLASGERMAFSDFEIIKE